MAETVRFELTRLTEYSSENIIKELQRVAELVPRDETLSIERFRKFGRVDVTTVRGKFGTWRQALDAAGLSHRSTEREGAAKTRKMTDEEIIRHIRKTAERLGTQAPTLAQIREHTGIGQRTLARRWGSTHGALRAAGLSTSNRWKRYTDEDCFRNMFDVWTHYGRPPQHREMSLLPSQVGPKAYVLRFGSWRKALAAFVEWIEFSTAESETEKDTSVIDTRPECSSKVVLRRDESTRGPRDVPIGLRFKVLHRDRFKCVLCGDHPASNLHCKLHVDHINPWSKGGATKFENLRTLCMSCNVGRGNRFDE